MATYRTLELVLAYYPDEFNLTWKPVGEKGRDTELLEFKVNREMLKAFPVKTFRTFLRQHGYTTQTFSDLCQEKYPLIYAKVSQFNIFGCPDSRDVDLVVVVDSLQKPIAEKDLQNLTNEVYLLTGPKELDVNYITLDVDGNIRDLLKGSRETQNIVMETYRHHPQKYPLIFKEKVIFDEIDKVRGLIKFVIDHIEVLTKINDVHGQRKYFYAIGIDQRIDLVSAMDIVDNGHPQFLECIKSLVVKCIQLCIYPAGVYTKQELARVGSVEIFGNTDFETHLSDMLYRRKYHPETFAMLWKLVVRILDRSKLRYNPPYRCTLDVKGTEVFTEVLVNEFAKSTEVPTETFVSAWLHRYGELKDNINEFSTVGGHVGVLPEDLPETVRERIFTAIPRSQEWLQLLKTYKCGRNNGLVHFDGTPEGMVVARYNLIRGVIVETAIIQMVNWTDVLGTMFSEYNDIIHSIRDYFIKSIAPFTIGMIVENVKPGSRGCAPDLLINTCLGIIVVEIKCIVGNSTSSFERAIDLATKQIKTAQEFLGSSAFSKGLFVLAKCIGSEITLEVSWVNGTPI